MGQETDGGHNKGKKKGEIHHGKRRKSKNGA